ncbi:MAG: succinylglutamate desuccinylase/aspartoacylase family protein [Chromatocurvus sp.]
MKRRFTFLHNPGEEDLALDPEALLSRYRGPLCIKVDGEDSSRCRALVTLLHGNEPSGLRAVWQWLHSGERPRVNLLFVIASVAAALYEQPFSHRMLPRARDLNRCFRPPFEDEQGRLAEEILTLLRLHNPEAIVDMHNTSGRGPDFAVVAFDDVRHDAVAALFTRRLVVCALDLGALMESSSDDCPVVTVEVGGREDPGADRVALAGVRRFAQAAELYPRRGDPGALEKLHAPVRLELRAGVTLTYAETPQRGHDVTLNPVIEHHNFGTVTVDTPLGWTSATPRQLFQARDAGGLCAVMQLLRVIDGILYPAQPLILFMITTHAGIAESDCLFYAVAADGSPVRGQPLGSGPTGT